VKYRIREARERLGWTQSDLAKKMGTTQQTIQRYEAGAVDVNSSKLVRLAEILGTTVDYLIGIPTNAVRACPGGTGFTKCGGNYAVSLLAGQKAEQKGYSQVLWLDSQERKYVEEVGAMNIFFKIDGKLYTAAALDKDGTVLPGVTRRSIIELLRDWGYEVIEGKLAIDDIMKAAGEGKLEEVFGSGTAAVVSPVKKLDYEDQSAFINNGEIGPLTQKLYDTLTGIQWGAQPDPFGWVVKL